MVKRVNNIKPTEEALFDITHLLHSLTHFGEDVRQFDVCVEQVGTSGSRQQWIVRLQHAQLLLRSARCKVCVLCVYVCVCVCVCVLCVCVCVCVCESIKAFSNQLTGPNGPMIIDETPTKKAFRICTEHTFGIPFLPTSPSPSLHHSLQFYVSC